MNCFGKVLKEYLLEIPAFSEQYEIHTYYMMDCVSKIDLDKVSVCDLFLYQHVGENALKFVNNPLNLDVKSYTPISLIRDVLPSDCIKISIPSPYFSGYFVNGTNEHAIKTLIDLPSSLRDYFPNYCFNADLLNMLIKRESLEYMLTFLSDPELYSKERVLSNLTNTVKNLRLREVENAIDIPMSDFIEENYQKKRLFHTTNHPTKHMFQYVINKILPIIGMDLCIELSVDKMTKVGRVPILPCVSKHLRLPCADADADAYANVVDFDGPYFIQGKPVDSLEAYISFYQSLFQKHGL